MSRLVLLAGLLLPFAWAADSDPDPEPPGEFPKTTPADRLRSSNNLKQIGLALHNYHDTFGTFPALSLKDKAGKPTLSWRVALLPYLEEGELYKAFRLEEPWDSPHNKKLLSRMPKYYAPPIKGKPIRPDATYYQAFFGKGAAFEEHGLRLASFTDGASNTLLVAEAGEPVPWTKPVDLTYDVKKRIPKLGGLFPEGFQACMADGSVRFFSRKLDEKTLRALITRSGGEVIDWKAIPLLTLAERK